MAEQEQSVELLPCPFCGEHASIAETRAAGHVFYGVDCLGCGAQVHESDPQRAALLWNRRPTPDAVNADKAVEVIAKAMFEADPDVGCTWEEWLAYTDEHNLHGQDIAFTRRQARAVAALTTPTPVEEPEKGATGDQVEIVAKAIYDATHAGLSNCYDWNDLWEDHQEARRDRYYKEARAAIAALAATNAGQVEAASLRTAVLDMPFANTAPIEWCDQDWISIAAALKANGDAS